MKNNLLSFFFFLCCVVATQLLSQRVWAQATSGSMTLDQLKSIKAIKIANLDKDTYFKSGGFILDRYEERPAYVFNYSDGIPRKIYLYKVFAAEDTKELGLLAIYQNGKTNEVKPFVIPGASADRKAWDAYIDDLKYVGEKEPGLMSALGFVLSREMAMLMAGGGAKSEEGGKKKEEYNFCFAPDAPVTLADGSMKAISDVVEGDLVMSYDAKSKALIQTSVTKIDRHQGDFAIAGVWLTPVQEITATNTNRLATPTLLEATANHPVLTAAGRKPLGEVHPGDVLYRYEPATKTVVMYKAVRTEPSVRTVGKVYNLSTQNGSYLVGETVVLDK
ncbi:Hedgehog/intein hint domain protein [Fibrisoma limi BUZ 3]|uniref:Hedgehog/intein hint domain protein n=1 Tax=Fibrisoma limi BUZ 3 TaxID=1185876 RepID=I2GTA9_9BACT|nr:Hint domain-containing protein [Fibrisoma limi]CCH57138.1 Hedgehog/intein hint domain protein [Fibrisoma limi BUZ 3]